MFLINSCPENFRCGPFPCEKGQTLSRSYGRCFAEFLEEHSLVRLGLLDPITCVGLRYGFVFIMLRGFSWKRALSNFNRPKPQDFRCAWTISPGFTKETSSHHERKSNNTLDILHSVPPSHKNKVMEY